MNQITVTIGKGNIERETEKAVLIDLGLGGRWYPKSQIVIELPNSYEAGTMTLPYWLAKKNDLTVRPIKCQL